VQQESIESYCKAFNIKLVKVFKDAGISGRSIRKRIDLQNLLEYVSNNPSQWGYRNKAAVALYFRSYLSSCSVTRL
jgi:phospholipase/lecithinase/hemolysin